MSSKYSRGGQERLWEGHKSYNVEGRLLFLKDIPSGYRMKCRCLRIQSKGPSTE